MKQSRSLSIVGQQSTRKKLKLNNITAKEKVHKMVEITFLRLLQGRRKLRLKLSGSSAEHNIKL